MRNGISKSLKRDFSPILTKFFRVKAQTAQLQEEYRTEIAEAVLLFPEAPLIVHMVDK
jgi:hypothetical protein